MTNTDISFYKSVYEDPHGYKDFVMKNEYQNYRMGHLELEYEDRYNGTPSTEERELKSYEVWSAENKDPRSTAVYMCDFLLMDEVQFAMEKKRLASVVNENHRKILLENAKQFLPTMVHENNQQLVYVNNAITELTSIEPAKNRPILFGLLMVENTEYAKWASKHESLLKQRLSIEKQNASITSIKSDTELVDTITNLSKKDKNVYKLVQASFESRMRNLDPNIINAYYAMNEAVKIKEMAKQGLFSEEKIPMRERRHLTA